MTKKEAIEVLQKLQKTECAQVAHSDADDVLCCLLESMKCKEVVKEWKNVPKWYA